MSTENKPAEWMLKAAGSCARKIWPGAARDADEGKAGGIADMKELTERIAGEFARHAPPSLECEAIEALEQLVDGLDANGDAERCGLSQEQWDARIKHARAVLARTTPSQAPAPVKPGQSHE